MAKERDLQDVLRIGAALLSAGAASIHFAVLPEHLTEYRPFGWFFFALGWFQMGWGAIVVRSPSRRVYVIGILGNALAVGIWLVSRTAGLPIGPNAGVPEESGPVDLLATVFEVLVVQLSAVLVAAPPTLRIRSSAGRLIIWLELVLVVGGTAMVLLTISASGHGQ